MQAVVDIDQGEGTKEQALSAEFGRSFHQPSIREPLPWRERRRTAVMGRWWERSSPQRMLVHRTRWTLHSCIELS